MTIYSGNWPTEAVGDFVVRRTYTFSDTNLNTIDFRDDAWFGAAWNIADADRLTAAKSRGVLKRINVRLVSGTGVKFFKTPVEDNNYNSIGAAASAIRLDYRNEFPRAARFYQMNAKATLGSEVVEFEIWFDIEEA